MNGGMLMLAGHAIYQGGRWHGGYQNEGRLYEAHVRDAFQICAAEGYEALVLSGGRSRPHLADEIGNSEAEGMLEYAQAAGLVSVDETVLLEHYGRDSFENVFFAMLCFYRRFGEWPVRVGAVSWKFKALRFYLIACGLGLTDGRFRFFGSGDPSEFEEFAIAGVQYDGMIVRNGEIIDPLHRDAHWFATKRLGRMPGGFATNAQYLTHVKKEYGHAELIDRVESLVPGSGWREIVWPW